MTFMKLATQSVVALSLLLCSSLANATSTDGTIDAGFSYGFVKQLKIMHDGSFVLYLSADIEGTTNKSVCQNTVSFGTVAAGLPARKDLLSMINTAHLAGRQITIEHQKISTVCYVKTVSMLAGY